MEIGNFCVEYCTCTTAGPRCACAIEKHKERTLYRQVEIEIRKRERYVRMYACMSVRACVCVRVRLCMNRETGEEQFFRSNSRPMHNDLPSSTFSTCCSNLFQLVIRSFERKIFSIPRKISVPEMSLPFPFPFPIILSFSPLPESGDTIILQRLATPLPFIPSNWINREPSALVAGEQRVHRAQLHLEGDWVGVRGPPRAHDRPMESRYEFSGKQGASFHFQERNSIGKNWSDKREKNVSFRNPPINPNPDYPPPPLTRHYSSSRADYQ